MITKPDELSALGRLVAVDDRNTVGNDAHFVSCPKIVSEGPRVRTCYFAPYICAKAVIKFEPKLGLNDEIRESSTRRSTTSPISNGLRMSGSIKYKRSSAEYRGGAGELTVAGDDGVL